MIWVANRNRIRQSAPMMPGKSSAGMADLGAEAGQGAEQQEEQDLGPRDRRTGSPGASPCAPATVRLAGEPQGDRACRRSA